jgi:hypothetical protein
MSTSSIVKFTSMAIGSAGMLISAYNVATDGHMHAHKHTEEELAEHSLDVFHKAGSSSRESNLLEKTKHYVVNRRINSPLYAFVIRTKNAAKCYAKEFLDNIDTIGLSAIALAAPVIARKTKNQAQKLANQAIAPQLPLRQKIGIGLSAAAASILVLDGIRVFVTEVWGAGKEH